MTKEEIISEFFSKIPSFNSEMMMTVPRELQKDSGAIVMNYNQLVKYFWEMMEKLEAIK